jgi:phage gp29-like protein
MHLRDKKRLSQEMEELLESTGKFSDKLIQGNIKALQKGFEEVE